MNVFQGILKRWRDRKMQKQIARACNEARRRVSAMSKEEREELNRRAMQRIYPGGWWNCETCHAATAAGTACKFCNAPCPSQP